MISRERRNKLENSQHYMTIYSKCSKTDFMPEVLGAFGEAGASFLTDISLGTEHRRCTWHAWLKAWGHAHTVQRAACTQQAKNMGNQWFRLNGLARRRSTCSASGFQSLLMVLCSSENTGAINRTRSINNSIPHATAALREADHFPSTFQVPSCVSEF